MFTLIREDVPSCSPSHVGICDMRMCKAYPRRSRHTRLNSLTVTEVRQGPTKHRTVRKLRTLSPQGKRGKFSPKNALSADFLAVKEINRVPKDLIFCD